MTALLPTSCSTSSSEQSNGVNNNLLTIESSSVNTVVKNDNKYSSEKNDSIIESYYISPTASFKIVGNSSLGYLNVPTNFAVEYEDDGYYAVSNLGEVLVIVVKEEASPDESLDYSEEDFDELGQLYAEELNYKGEFFTFDITYLGIPAKQCIFLTDIEGIEYKCTLNYFMYKGNLHVVSVLTDTSVLEADSYIVLIDGFAFNVGK
jgi:hypothetical protein